MVSFSLPGGDTDTFKPLIMKTGPKLMLLLSRLKKVILSGMSAKRRVAIFIQQIYYKWLVDKFGSLYSDSKQTTAGEGIWRRLQQDPEITVEEPSEETVRWRVSK